MDSNLKKPIRKPHGYQPVRKRKKANGNRETYSYEDYVRKNKPAGSMSDMSMNNPRESKQMDKKLIRLTESDLQRIVKESVNRVLKEDFNHDQYVQLVQGAYDKVAEATDLIREASSMVQSEGTYHIGYLNEAYKALGTAIGALQAADASMPKSGRRGYLDMGEDV